MTWKTVKSKGQQKREKRAEKFWTCPKCSYEWSFLNRSQCYKCSASMPTSLSSPKSKQQQSLQNKQPQQSLQSKNGMWQPPRQGGSPYTEGDGDHSPPTKPASPLTQPLTSMKHHVNAPMMIAKQSGLIIPDLIPVEMDDAEMDLPRAPKPSYENLPESYYQQRECLRESIVKHESVIKLLDPDQDSSRIKEFEAMISRDKLAITSLKPLPYRIESLQRVVDTQAQRVMRANHVINNWQLLRDAWQTKHEQYAQQLVDMKRQLAETQANEVGSKLEPNGSEQHLSQLQSHVQQLAQLLQGIVTTAQNANGDPTAFTNLIGTANQALISMQTSQPQAHTGFHFPMGTPQRCPMVPASLGTVQADVHSDHGCKPTPTGNSPLPAHVGASPHPTTGVPTPARATFNAETVHQSERRTLTRSPRRQTTRVSRSPVSPSRLERMTMTDAQAQEDLLLANAEANLAPLSPMSPTDFPVAFTPAVRGGHA